MIYAETPRESLVSGGFPRRHREALRGLPWLEGQSRAGQTCVAVVKRAGIVALLGDRGRGKTQIATGVAMTLASETPPWSVRYFTFAEMLADFRGKVYSGEWTDARWFSDRASARFLTIDELGERRDTEDELLLLTRVLDYRYRNVRGTLVIANTKADRLAESIGPSASDRLREGGSVIECDWPSFRGAKK